MKRSGVWIHKQCPRSVYSPEGLASARKKAKRLIASIRWE